MTRKAVLTQKTGVDEAIPALVARDVKIVAAATEAKYGFTPPASWCHDWIAYVDATNVRIVELTERVRELEASHAL